MNEFDKLIEDEEKKKVKKGINRAKKGYTKEKQIRDKLTKEGWLVVFKSTRTRFGAFDYAGLFDIVAYKGQERIYVSSKHLGAGNYYLSHQKEITLFREECGKEGESYELWLWDKPRWRGRGKNKYWNKGGWIIKKL